MKAKFFWLFFLLLLFLSSYYREVFFRSINAIMAGEEFFYAKTTALPFLLDWSVSELNRLKYFLTAFFSIWFMGISLLGLKLGIRSNLGFGLLAVIYLLLILIAAVAIIIGLGFLDFQTVYPFLRKLIGIIHNPLPYLLISIGVYGVEALKAENRE